MSTGESTSRDDFEIFARHLRDDTVKKILGTHLSDGERVEAGTTPRTTFFSGALVGEDVDADIDEDIRSRVSPSELGMFANLVDADGKYQASVDISFALYYRVIPKPDTVVDGDVDLPIIYRKHMVTAEGIEITLPASRQDPEFQERREEVERQLRETVSKAVDDARKEIADDPWLLNAPLGDDEESALADFLEERKNLDDEDLSSELADSRFTTDDSEADAVPNPRIHFSVNLTGAVEGSDGSDTTTLFRLDIKNATRIGDDDDYAIRDDAIYQTKLKLTAVGPSSLRPIRFRQLDDSYRYDLDVPGQGHNCTVEWTDEERTTIETNTAPTHRQPFFEHRSLAGDANPRFDSLAEDPVPVLRAIKTQMEEYLDENWEAKLDEERDKAGPGSETVKEIRKTMTDFREEIDAFERGIDVLERHEDARNLFQAVNEIFIDMVTGEDGEMEYESWRPFQIVFIVSNLPDILGGDTNYDIDPNRDEVSLVFIPTGGGKTEAYLALLAFAALFDRMRGKEFGVTAMTRFPLRLLTLQQAQRVHEILMHADVKRRELDLGGEAFSLGYFSGATENKLEQLINREYNSYPGYARDPEDLEENRSTLRSFARDWEGGDLDTIDTSQYRMVERCPLCDTDIEVRVDPEEARIVHVCDGPCDQDRMNVHVTDQAIYRALPTMILGTQDKLAALGYEYRFRTVAGHATHRCDEHGYTHSADECLMGGFCARGNDFSDEELETVNLENPAPTLTIQDELHLLNEEIGTFESHYYAAYEQHLEWAAEMHGGEFVPPKKIAATATIEEYENQIRHLYNADAKLFPVKGPEYRESFYTTLDKERTQRHFIGVTPWNRSQINSIVRILEMHQRRLQDMLEAPDEHKGDIGLGHLNDEAFRHIVAHYYVLVTYVISRNEGARVYKSAENQVNENLSRDGYDTVTRGQITGGASHQEISELLAKLEDLGEPGATNLDDIEELIVATSSISHGVDLDALNFMQFFNAPPRMAEYIQASSRVGRKYPGIVLDVFHPIQERDRSHYHYFDKYHQYRDRLVEPVAINRWAKHSVGRTYPGLLYSLFLIREYGNLSDEFGYISNRTKARKIKKAEKKLPQIDQDSIREDLVAIYGEDWHSGECPFENRLETLVNKTFSEVLSGSHELLEDCIEGRKMTSLRDIDEQIPLKISSDHRDIIHATR